MSPDAEVLDAATRERIAALPPLDDDQAQAVAAMLDHIATRARQQRMSEAASEAAPR